jgi:hypothetical protein
MPQRGEGGEAPKAAFATVKTDEAIYAFSVATEE